MSKGRNLRACALFVGVSAIAVASSAAQAQDCLSLDTGEGLCPFTLTEDDAIVSTTGAFHLINQANGTSVTHNNGAYLLIENAAGASIDSITLSPTPLPFQSDFEGIPYSKLKLAGTTIINAGTISDLQFANGGTYIDAGGTITGNLISRFGNEIAGTPNFLLGFRTETVIDRDGGGIDVDGILDPGNGLDFYAESYSATAIHAIPTTLPTNFEVAGVEALGVGTTITLTNVVDGSPVNGVSLYGEGNFINTAIIDPISFVGTGLPPANANAVPTRAVVYGGIPGQMGLVTWSNGTANPPVILTGTALNSFVNRGVINGDLGLTVATFSNESAINLASRQPGTLIFTAADRDFTFRNSGTVSMANDGEAANRLTDAVITLVTAFNSASANAVDIGNAGQIEGGLTFAGNASNFIFDNSGTIAIGDNPNDVDRAVNLEIGRFEFPLSAALSEIRADSVTINNSGTLDGGISVGTRARTASFTNSGDISADATDPFAEAIEFSVYDFASNPAEEPEVDAESVTFVNTSTGTITGSTIFQEMETTSLSVTNDGSMIQGALPVAGPFPYDSATLQISQETILGATLDLNNSGVISNAAYAGIAVDLEVEAGSLDEGVPGADTANGTINFTNSGTIASTGGSYLTPGAVFGTPQAPTRVEPSIALAASVDAEGVGTINITNEAAGLITSRGAPNLFTGTVGPLPGAAANASGIAIGAQADRVNIVNRGTILGAPGSLIVQNVTFDVEVDLQGVFGSGIDTFNSIDLVTNEAGGLIEGGIALRDGNDRLENFGTITGNIFLGIGNDSFVQGINAILNGIADGGAGEDSFLLDITGGGQIDASIYDQLLNFELLSIIGTAETIELGGGAPVVFEEDSVIEGSGPVAITGSEGGDDVTLLGTVNGIVDVGEGDDTLSNSGTINGTLLLGDGNNQANITGTGTVTGDITAGLGNDTIANSGTIGGSVALGGGDNALNNEGTISGSVTGGTGDDTVVNNGTVTGDVDLSGEEPIVSFAAFSGAQSILAVAAAPAGDNLVNADTIEGDVITGSGDDSVTNSGTILGDIDLGAGDDILTLAAEWELGGTATGGEGDDSLSLSLTGQTDPFELTGTKFTSFENTSFTGGTVAVNGTLESDLSVTAGYVFGRAGSLIEGDVVVAAGGTFGSAGTVNGNVTVAGTLSPGASPGTLTVKGDLALANGSTTVFEMTPTVSDAIVVDGAVTIGSSTTLNITGTRPLTPGVTYSLITASDGISGSFSTINKAAGVLGFLRQSANSLDLLGTLQISAGAAIGQNQLTVDYINDLLIGGTAPAALVSAFPSLLAADGFANQSVAATISPEAYASVVQTGIENGLVLARAVRRIDAGPLDGDGLFAFGQAYGSWRNLDGDARGVSSADIRSTGFLGGIGYATEAVSVAAFLGKSDTRQRINTIAARNDSDGLFFGARIGVTAGGFEGGASVIFDRAEADTARTTAGSDASSRYDLHGLTLDADLGFRVPFSQSFVARPSVGVTHIKVERDAVIESGGGAFGLSVEGRKYDATFLNADLRFEVAQPSSLAPWIEVGVRHRASGDPIVATGGFSSVTGTYTVIGAERKKTLGHAGGGLAASLTPQLSVFVSGDVEFGGRSHNRSLNGGISFSF